jgi:hypothetical protein
MQIKKLKFVLVCISISLFCLIFSSVSYAKVDMKACIGAWLFDEGKGDTAKDSSGSGNDAKIVNGVKWATGQIGGALDFDGADDVLNIQDNANLNGFSDITMMSWIYLRREVTSGTWNAIAGKNPYSNGYLIWIQVPCEPCGLVFAGGVRFDARTGAKLDLKRWYHLAFTRDAKGVMKFYIDGVLATTAASTAGPITTIAGPLAIGGQSPQIIDGMLDEVIMFNTALVESDIKGIMTNGLLKANDVSLAGKFAECWGKLKNQ